MPQSVKAVLATSVVTTVASLDIIDLSPELYKKDKENWYTNYFNVDEFEEIKTKFYKDNNINSGDDIDRVINEVWIPDLGRYNFMKLMEKNNENFENTLVFGDPQVGKTALEICFGWICVNILKKNVVHWLRNANADKSQLCERLKSIDKKIEEVIGNSSLNFNVIEIDKDIIHKDLKKNINYFIGITFHSHAKTLSDAFDKNNIKQIYIINDEADLYSGSTGEQSKTEDNMDSLKSNIKILASLDVTASPLANIINTTFDNIFLLEISPDYIGIDKSEHENVSCYQEFVSKMKLKHNFTALINITNKTIEHQHIKEYIQSIYGCTPNMAIIIFNGGKATVHTNKSKKGIKFDTIKQALNYCEQYPEVFIISGLMAGRGITFRGDRKYLTHLFIDFGDNPTIEGTIQKTGRLFLKHKEIANGTLPKPKLCCPKETYDKVKHVMSFNREFFEKIIVSGSSNSESSTEYKRKIESIGFTEETIPNIRYTRRRVDNKETNKKNYIPVGNYPKPWNKLSIFYNSKYSGFAFKTEEEMNKNLKSIRIDTDDIEYMDERLASSNPKDESTKYRKSDSIVSHCHGIDNEREIVHNKNPILRNSDTSKYMSTKYSEENGLIINDKQHISSISVGKLMVWHAKDYILIAPNIEFDNEENIHHKLASKLNKRDEHLYKAIEKEYNIDRNDQGMNKIIELIIKYKKMSEVDLDNYFEQNPKEYENYSLLCKESSNNKPLIDTLFEHPELIRKYNKHGKTMVDMGCGPNPLNSYPQFADTKIKCTNIDHVENKAHKVICSKMTETKLKSNSYNIALFNRSIDYDRNSLENYVKEAKRITTEDGIIIIILATDKLKELETDIKLYLHKYKFSPEEYYKYEELTDVFSYIKSKKIQDF